MNSLAFKETESPLVQLWRDELIGELNKFVRVATNLNTAISEADKYLQGNHRTVDIPTNIAKVVTLWLESVCEIANTEAKNVTHIKIDLNHLPSNLSKFNFRGYGLSGEDCVSKVIRNFDFELLESSLNIAKSEIEGQGLMASAKDLIEAFSLGSRYNNSDSDISTKKVKGRYLLTVSYYGRFNHDRTKWAYKLKQAARSFENESNIVGLSFCLQMLINEENSLDGSGGSYIPSRTKLAEDGNVTATVYNEKIKFAFEPFVFEALISFVDEYKSDSFRLYNFKP
jgi:hypothetical protein